MDTKYFSFDEWLAAVDNIISEELGGLTSIDLPDKNYVDWYSDDISPELAANRAISDNSDLDDEDEDEDDNDYERERL